MGPPAGAFYIFNEAMRTFILGFGQATAGYITTGLGQFLGDARPNASGNAGN
jgi:hypothetical protein